MIRTITNIELEEGYSIEADIEVIRIKIRHSILKDTLEEIDPKEIFMVFKRFPTAKEFKEAMTMLLQRIPDEGEMK